MSPEDEARIRHLMRKGNQLPMPISHLLKSVSKRSSRFREPMPTLEKQAEEQKALEKRIKKKNDGRVHGRRIEWRILFLFV